MKLKRFRIVTGVSARGRFGAFHGRSLMTGHCRPTGGGDKLPLATHRADHDEL
jgi:hypothetical protein